MTLVVKQKSRVKEWRLNIHKPAALNLEQGCVIVRVHEGGFFGRFIVILQFPLEDLEYFVNLQRVGVGVDSESK